MATMKIREFVGDRKYSSNLTAPAVPITDAVRSWDVPYMSLFYQLEDATTPEERLRVMEEMMVEEQMKVTIRQSLEAIASKVVPSNPKLMFIPATTTPTLEQEYCYEHAIGRYTDKCYRFDEYDYAMKDLHMFANLCSQGVSNEEIFDAIDEACSA